MINKSIFAIIILNFVLFSCNMNTPVIKPEGKNEIKNKEKSGIISKLTLFSNNSKILNSKIDTVSTEIKEIMKDFDPKKESGKKIDQKKHIDTTIELGEKLEVEIDKILQASKELDNFTNTYKKELTNEDKIEIDKAIKDLENNLSVLKDDKEKLKELKTFIDKANETEKSFWGKVGNFITGAVKTIKNIIKEIEDFFENVVQPLEKAYKEISKVLEQISQIISVGS